MRPFFNTRSIKRIIHQTPAFFFHPTFYKLSLLVVFLAAIASFRLWSEKERGMIHGYSSDEAEPSVKDIPADKVDINRMTAKEFERLPKIGPVLAAAIVEDRDKNGPFRTLEDLLRVKGIGPARLVQIKSYILLNE